MKIGRSYQLGNSTIQIFVLFLCTLLSACASNQQSNPFATTPGQSPNPQNGANGGRISSALSSLRPRNRANIQELYRRAQEQERLAGEQQAELSRLRDLQLRYDQLVENLQKNEEQQKQQKRQNIARINEDWQKRAKDAIVRNRELSQQAQGLDSDNRELQARLARVQQQYQLLKEQNTLFQQQLRDTADQLVTAQTRVSESQKRVKALQTSAMRRGGAQITANNSLRKSITAVSIDGVDVQQDGELVRIILPSDQLFMPGTATLVRGAEQRIDYIAKALLQNYPNQVVGIEAHTDNSQITGSLWRNHHQLTAAQSVAIFEQFSYRHGMLSDQMFVLGNGKNYPLVSNGTAAGQARNRRIEIVIYPDLASGRR